jgi:hypothetical protein
MLSPNIGLTKGRDLSSAAPAAIKVTKTKIKLQKKPVRKWLRGRDPSKAVLGILENLVFIYIGRAFNDTATSAPLEKIVAARLITALKHENFTNGFDFHGITIFISRQNKRSRRESTGIFENRQPQTVKSICPLRSVLFAGATNHESSDQRTQT